jgi:HD-GYP domain-containing protein (c-di-GMP phosphodiesterase class II)
VAIENAGLYAQIQRTLESFVAASVSAIDLRDPTMAGHSLRVAALTTGLAEAVERSGAGPFKDVRFTPKQMRELRFAALLHDFGKVAVREDLLLKAKKLPPVPLGAHRQALRPDSPNHGARVPVAHGRMGEQPMTMRR